MATRKRTLPRPRTVETVKKCRKWQRLRRTVRDRRLPVEVRTAALDRLDELYNANPYMSESDRCHARTLNQFDRLAIKIEARLAALFGPAN